MKIRVFLAVCICCLLFCGCSASKPAAKWDCSVQCAKESEDSYVITYSKEQIVSQTGKLTFQNRNKFDIVIHLQEEGKEETVEVYAGSCSALLQIKKGTAYTVGCHAAVPEDTEIRLMVYDGEWSEIY